MSGSLLRRPQLWVYEGQGELETLQKTMPAAAGASPKWDTDANGNRTPAPTAKPEPERKDSRTRTRTRARTLGHLCVFVSPLAPPA